MRIISITDIEGFKFGHAQNRKAATGCTVIIAPNAAAAGVDVRGNSPATRETDLLKSEKNTEKINAVVLSGGSAYGLDAAGGVMKYLEEKGIGFKVPAGIVPIVCGASLYDLGFGDASVRPDFEMGYEACKNADGGKMFMQGSFGAGCGATVGKYFGMDHAMKSGIGFYACQVGDLKVGAIVAVNALGDVYGEDGEKLAGLLNEDCSDFADTCDAIINSYSNVNHVFGGNTTLGCIVTNARLSKLQCNRIASSGHDAYARSIRPVHTQDDGDCIFCMASGIVEADSMAVEVLAQKMISKAIENAVINA